MYKELVTATIQNSAADTRATDYDLHGLAGIRLLDAAPADVAAVTRQLGPIQAPLRREPDIVIRFVDRLPTSSRVRYLGVDEAGFTDDAFLVLRSKHKVPARVRIPFEQIGSERCEIVCERGLPAVPFLIPILNLTVLSRGALPLHASAFLYRGLGVVTTGWSKGGKTETLLAFTAHGAEYIGDEWVYVSGDGRRIAGIPEPVRLWQWHLRELPDLRARLARGERTRLRATEMAYALARLGERRSRFLARLAPLLKRQLHVDVHPRRLFGGRAGSLSGSFDRLIFTASHAGDDVIAQPIDPQEVADRMVFSLQYERLDLMAYYLMFRFAFPEMRNEFIEQAEERQRELLSRVLAGKEAYAVYHPYPVPIPALFRAVEPLIAGDGVGRSKS